MWPISGCVRPCIRRPFTMPPPPTPVPTVRYRKLPRSCAAPQRNSPSAAAFTSVSKATFTPKASRMAPAKLKFLQANLGVAVIKPKVGDAGFGSMGPKEAMTIALTGCRVLKNSTVRLMVSSGVVVGTSPTSRSSGRAPKAQTNLVPPASIPPTQGIVIQCTPVGQASGLSIGQAEACPTPVGYNEGVNEIIQKSKIFVS